MVDGNAQLDTQESAGGDTTQRPDAALLYFRDLYRELFFEQLARPDAQSIKPARRFEEQWRDLPRLREFRTVPGLNWRSFVDLDAAPQFRPLAQRVAEAVQTERTADDRSIRSLAVCSFARDEGRTTIALHLARDLAYRVGMRVVLVDYDFPRRELMDLLPVTPLYAYKDVLEGKVQLDACGILSVADRFMILPSTGQFPRNHKQGAGVREFLDSMVPPCVDLVIFDMPPLSGLEATVTALLRHVDASILVRASAREHEFRALVNVAKQAGPNVLGYIRNGVPTR